MFAIPGGTAGEAEGPPISERGVLVQYTTFGGMAGERRLYICNDGNPKDQVPGRQ